MQSIEYRVVFFIVLSILLVNSNEQKSDQKYLNFIFDNRTSYPRIWIENLSYNSYNNPIDNPPKIQELEIINWEACVKMGFIHGYQFVKTNPNFVAFSCSKDPMKFLFHGILTFDYEKAFLVEKLQKGKVPHLITAKTLQIKWNKNIADLLSVSDRIKRSTFLSSWHIKVLIVADSSMSQHYAYDDLIIYLMSIFKDVQRVFRDGSLGQSFSLSLTRILEITDDNDRGLIFSPNSNEAEMLETFCLWQDKLKNHQQDNITIDNQHDLAILVTRKDLCGKNSSESCKTLGLAELGSICRPRKSCTINHDNGISVAHTIAHEIGHTLDIPHDVPNNKSYCSYEYDKGNFVMAPSLENDVRRLSWSNCSRTHLSEFLNRGKADCIKNTNPDQSGDQSNYFHLPPGALFDIDLQCRLKLGGNKQAKSCSTQDPSTMCQLLWCELNNTCLTYGDPPALGTYCGVHKWCQDGKCVDISTFADASSIVHGQWNIWSSWTHCSTSCGIGIQSRKRTCSNPKPQNGGLYCVGDHKEHKVCQLNDSCQNNRQESLNDQCRKFSNSKSSQIDLTQAKFHAVTNPDNRCHLQCFQVYKNLKSHFYLYARDGTLCGNETVEGVCLFGKCRKVGCDLLLYSNARRDKCGVCNGNGSSCQEFSGTFYNTANQNGYHYVTTLPIKSSNILIRENIRPLTTSSSYIALIFNETGVGILNWNFRIQWPGRYNFDHQLHLLYDRDANFGSHSKQEIRIVSSSLRTPIDVYVLIQGNFSQINWNYFLSNHETNQSTNNYYDWQYSSWSECSKSCGKGVRVSHPHCVNIRTNTKVKESSLCKKLKPTSRIEQCHLQLCPPEWRYGQWQKCQPNKLCINMCQNPTKCHSTCHQRSISHCKNYDGNCCCSVVCSYSDVCTASLCNDCFQIRSVLCTQGNKRALPNEFCDPSLKVEQKRKCECPKATTTTINTNSSRMEFLLADGCQQKFTAHSKVSITYTNNTKVDKRKNILYLNTTTSSKSHLNNCPCSIPGNKISSNYNYYSDQLCSKSNQCFNWLTGNWTECQINQIETNLKRCVTTSRDIKFNQTIKGWKWREVKCPFNKENKDYYHCDLRNKPNVKETCLIDCSKLSTSWWAGPWSKCSATCDTGIKKRKILCTFANQRPIINLQEARCSQLVKPKNQMECNRRKCSIDSFSSTNPKTINSIELPKELICKDKLAKDLCKKFRNICQNKYLKAKCCQTCSGSRFS